MSARESKAVVKVAFYNEYILFCSILKLKYNQKLNTFCDNGITLSESIHKEFHAIYGNGNNTKEQFLEFINNLYKEKRITNDGYNLLLKKIKNE